MARKKRSSFDATTGDLFLCFTSKPSLSPGRRPLRGAQSPMFPSGRRKAPNFDAPVEPSSPKVTCIGQVRVKSKKKRPKSSSFRRGEFSETKNPKWGLNCLFICVGGEISGGERVERKTRVVVEEERVFREVVDVEVEVSEERVFREVFEVSEERNEVVEEESGRVSVCVPPRNALLLMRCRSDPVRMAALASRFWDSPKADDEEVDGFSEEVDGDECEVVGRDGIRDAEVGESDGFLEEGGLEGKEKEDGELDVEEVGFVDSSDVRRITGGGGVDSDVAESVELEKKGEEARNENRLLDGKEEEMRGRRSSSCSSTDVKEGRKSIKWHMKLRESGRRPSLSSKDCKEKRRHSFSNEEVRRSSFSSDMDGRRSSFCIERSRSSRRWSFCLESEDLRLEKIAFKEEKKMEEKKEEEETTIAKGSEKAEAVEVETFLATEEGPKIQSDIDDLEDKKDETVNEERRDTGLKSQVGFEKESEKSGGLPDCLLLMMYEPKLSMEVSKETWVCSTDFLRWRPNHPQYRPCHPSGGGKINDQGGGKGELDNVKVETKIKEVEEMENIYNEIKQMNMPVLPATKTPATPPQPLPSAPTIEKKIKSKGNAGLVSAPALPCCTLVLTRCKSEPMRSSERLIPDACFWKDRHRPIGATGIGF